MRRPTGIALWLAVIAGASSLVNSQSNADYRSIDQPTMLAWERAGGIYKVVADLPGFVFRPGEIPSPEELRNLPEPRVPFGLDAEDVLTVPMIEALGSFRNLHALHCYRCDPATLRGLPAVRELRHLRLSLRGDTPPEAIEVIRQLPHLTELSTRYLTVTSQALSHIASLDRLDTLSLRFSELNDDGLKKVATMKRLRWLDLQGTKVTSDGLRILASLSDLRHLEIGGATLSTNVPESLAKLTQLESLVLYYPKHWEATWISQLSGLSGLRRLSLYLSQTRVSATDLEGLKSMKALEALSIYGGEISDDGMASLGGLTQLRFLSLAGSPVNDRGLSFISGLAGLRELEVNGTDVTNAGVDTILRLQQLNRLYLNGGITDAGLARLSALPRLEHVRLPARPGVTSDGIAAMMKVRPAMRIGDVPVAALMTGLEIESAIAIEDPGERLAALERARAGAGPFDVRRIDAATLWTLSATSPERSREIGAVLDRVVAAMPSGSPASTRLRAVVDDLERIADQAALAPRVQRIVTADLPAVTDGGLRARGLAVVGRAQLAQGHLAEARASITESLRLQARANPRDVAPLRAVLAQVEAASGNVAGALESYVSAAAAMTLKPAQEQQFRQLYERLHGTDSGREAAVRRRHRELLPNPVKATPYSPPANRSRRVVLIELFTGSGCGPCVAADLAFDALLDRYSAGDVAALAYHRNVPLPDPMTVTASQQSEYYQVNGVPGLRIDGIPAGDFSGTEAKA